MTKGQICELLVKEDSQTMNAGAGAGAGSGAV